MPALFLKLLNMSISASWLVLAIVVLRFLMKKAPKWMTCALWALVAIRLVFPFSIESMFSIVPSAQTLPPEILNSNRFEISSGIPVIDHQINDVILDSYYDGVTVPTDNGFNVMSTLTVVWLVGMAVMALYATVSYLVIRRKVSASICLRDNICLCDYIESPFILGIFRPRIYLPSALDQAQWPHVIAHEKAHLHRRDHWWKPLGFAILCVYWFNPVLWLAYVLLCRDIELACDERVIRDMDSQQKKSYSAALLECSMPRYLIAACPLAFGEVGVKERVKTVLNYKKPAFWIILIAIILCVAVAVCFLTDPIIGNTPDTGITLTARNVSPTGVTIDCTQSGGNLPGPFAYGNNYYLQRHTENGWVNIPNLNGDYGNVVTMEAYWLSLNESVSWSFNWSSRYGALEPGLYRFVRHFSDFSTPEDNSSLPSYAEFRIPEESASPAIQGTYQFSATVLEVNDGSILVEPLPGTENHPGMDRIWVRRTLASSGKTVQGIAAGDIVSIQYDGIIAETYPGQINTVYDIQKHLEHLDPPKEPLSPCEISIEVTNATATEGLVIYHINNQEADEIWTGYSYHLEVLTDDGWVHYGYPPEELAWEAALLFHISKQDPADTQNSIAFPVDWSRTANTPLPAGTYRYCKGITVISGDEISNQAYYAEFTVSENCPVNWGIHMEILNPTDTGATLAITYNGGLMGELSTMGQYYLMVDVGDGARTKYGIVPSQVAWDDVRYSLAEGETVYLDVRWDHTADAPLPEGTYYVVLEVDQSVPNGYGSGFHNTKNITGEFQITSATAGTEPPGSYYRLTTVECLYMNPASSQLPQAANGKYYIFDNSLFQIVQHSTKQVLFECSTEDTQWQEFPFTEERWAEIMPFGGSEIRDRLWGAQYLRLSDNYCLFLKDDSLYVAYGHFNSEIPIEYFWDIYKLGIN